MIAGSHKVGSYWRKGLRASLVLAAGLGGLGQAWAQQDDADELEPVSRAVVQPLPSQQGYQLNAALTRLAANPRDVSALLDAGNAALALGDTDAALGFYGRADQLSPNDPRIKTALASALVRNEDPFAAIPLFEAAERAGARDGALAGDRGLAYDLVGDNLSAQQHYRQALAAAAPGASRDEIVRRLALSQAIAGDRKGSEATLLTQLRRNDPGAWRTRAFVLAILGDTEEAVRIANGTMPRDLAGAMIPYLRYMGRLTPAQQAAAANFGHFPRAAQIGRDDPRVARYAALNPRRAPVPAAAAAVKADASGKRDRTQDDRLGRRRDRARQDRNRERDGAAPGLAQVGPAQQRTGAATAAPPAPAPRTIAPVRIAAATPTPAVMPRPAETRPVVSLSPPMVTPPAPAGSPPLASLGSAPVVGPPASAPAPITLPPSTPAPSPGPAVAIGSPDLARRAQGAAGEPAPAPGPSPTPAPAPAVAAAGVPAAEPRRDLAALFSDFRPPEEEQRAAIAVDISKLPVRAKKAAPADERGPVPDAPTGTKRIVAADPATSTGAKTGADTAKAGKAPTKATKPAAPTHPSRIWVQIGVGRDKGALGFDWRKLGKADADLLKGRKAWTTPWGQTNRLLVGPFESQAAAQAFLKDMRKKAADAFLWTSPAGQAVDALGGK